MPPSFASSLLQNLSRKGAREEDKGEEGGGGRRAKAGEGKQKEIFFSQTYVGSISVEQDDRACEDVARGRANACESAVAMSSSTTLR
eukprot:768255-Hanusia_phi.AAC.2